LLAVLVASMAVRAGAAPPPGTLAAQTAHLDFSGRGGTAVWSSCPAEPTVGTVCTSTFRSAVFVEKGNRAPVRRASALLEQATFRFDEGAEGLEITLLSSTSASGEIDLAIDRALDAASFEATLGSQTSVPVGDEFVCGEGTVAVAASWTGTSDLVRVDEHSTPGGDILGPPLLIVHERGVVREAAAAVTVDAHRCPERFSSASCSMADRTTSNNRSAVDACGISSSPPMPCSGSTEITDRPPPEPRTSPRCRTGSGARR
jgi:hypothetical protein